MASPISESLRREIRAARTDGRPIAQVKVTAAAIPGMIVALPTPGLGMLEIALHPDDWFELLKEPTLAVSRDLRGGPFRAFGVPVVHGE